MSCDLRLSAGASRHSTRGLTLVETLVALAIVFVFFSGAVMAFLQIVRVKEQTQARLDALANGRHALETMSLEIKRARLLPPGSDTSEEFRGWWEDLLLGDRIDNDTDGITDEEAFDGADDDGDWTAADDRHAVISATSGTLRERHQYVNLPDLGDARVDEDTRFSSSTLVFQTFPLPGGATERQVEFTIGNDPADGQPNTLLMKTTESDPLTSGIDPLPPAEYSPIAHNVLSFTALYYDAIGTTGTAGTATNPWKKDWQSDDPLRDRATQPTVPASVYLTLSVYSGTRPLSGVTETQPLPSVTLHTVVDVESVLADPRYDSNLRVPQITTP